MNRYAFYSNVEKYKDANPEEHEKDAIKHYGIMGQKWGQRRWQNPDGTFNQDGKERYFGSSKNEKNPDGSIGNSSNKKNPSGNMEGSVADHFHKNVYLKTDKNTLKKIKKYPDIYDTEGLTDKEILQAIRRVPKIPYSAEYGRLVREELYRTQMNKKRAKYYDDNSKDVSEEENIEDQKIEGFDPKEEKKLEKKAEKAAKGINDEFDDAIGYHEKEELMDSLIHDSEYTPLFEEIRKNNREKYGKEKDRAAEIFDGFENNRNEMYAKAGITNALLYMDDDTMNTISSMARHYIYDDGDQGNSNSSSLYAKYEKDADYDELSNLYETLCNNKEMIKDNINTLKKDRTLSKVKEEYLEDLVEHNNWSSINSRLYNATEDSSAKNDDERNAYAESKKIAKKLEPSCGARGSGWYYLNQAINNLGMASMSYKELTDADWDKINAEVNKLKK